MNKETNVDRLKKILKHREIFTPMELVKLGIYGSKSSVHRFIDLGELNSVWITPRRIVVFKDSVIEHVKKLNAPNIRKRNTGFKKKVTLEEE